MSSSRPLALPHLSSRPARPSPRRKGLSHFAVEIGGYCSWKRYLSSVIRPDCTPVVSRSNLSAPTPARGSPTPPLPDSHSWGFHVVHRRCRQLTIFPRHPYSAIVQPGALGGEHGSRYRHVVAAGTSHASWHFFYAQRRRIERPASTTSTHMPPLRRHNSLHLIAARLTAQNHRYPFPRTHSNERIALHESPSMTTYTSSQPETNHFVRNTQLA